MFSFSVNFNMYYLILTKEARSIFKDTEFKVFVGIVIASIAVIAINLYSTFGSFYESLHHSAFQVASIISTTGFSTVDFNQWPMLSKMILFILMFVGACAGSTGGGIKVSRIVILFKSIARQIKKLVHPNSVKLTRMNGKVVSNSLEHSVNGYLVAYFIVSIASILLLSFENLDFETTVSAVVACVNNIGPGFGLVGPACNFGALSAFSKLVLCADMLIGRLEIFPMLILFSPTLWRRTK